MEETPKSLFKSSKPINIPKSNISRSTNITDTMYSEFEISKINSIKNKTPIPLIINKLKYSNIPFKPNTPAETSPKLPLLNKQKYMDSYAVISLISSKSIA